MSIDQTTINTIRTLSMDAVQAAQSGHPGTPMALAPVAYELWANHLRYDPFAPRWPNRDRFVLSCGHASMLLYSLIHLAGVRQCDGDGRAGDEEAVSLEEIRRFRQWGSRTPGHPEYRHTSGVETTTGPLGQGCGNSVGMAIAGRLLAARYNRPGFDLFDYDIYVQCSDGDLMEGVACEAASLAAHLKLSNLCWIYDDNRITIEGPTSLAFSENVAERFRGLGWHVLGVEDANDLAALSRAYGAFKQCGEQPTLIVVKSVIAYGAPTMQNTAAAHGAPLGDEEIRRTKEVYGWPSDARFLVPREVADHFRSRVGTRGGELRMAWEAMVDRYRDQYPQLAAELDQIVAGELPSGWDAELPVWEADAKGMATRSSSGKVLNAVASGVPWLVGGSADLAPSNNTLLKSEDAGHLAATNPGGRNMHFGIREHAMASIANGIALCHLRPYAATFFVFTDYMRPAMRLAAMMKLPVVYVLTHDSIGVGEDGPTHQPVEQAAACRAIPNLVVLRPADANETREAWRTALLQKHRPVALVLTRQNVPTLCRKEFAPASGLAKGGYVLADADGGVPDVVLIATGSEVSLAIQAREALSRENVRCRVVSMPSFELFAEQDAAYRDAVLPPGVTARVGIEAGVRQGWDRYLGPRGVFVGLDDFGASAPFVEVYQQRGLTVERVVGEARSLLGS